MAAALSECGRYRYALTRWWEAGPSACFIMLNLSTADATTDDPTIRRCIGFSKREGCGSLTVLNLFALRATDPRELANHPAPIGPDWRHWFDAMLAHVTGPLILGWGAQKGVSAQVEVVREILHFEGKTALCLGKTSDGSPRHPLYVKRDAPLEPFWVSP